MPKVFVGNISFDATESQLRNHFDQVANVTKATIVLDRETGKPRGFGFVEFETDKGAKEAIEHLNGVEMMGRALDVQPSRERLQQGRGPNQGSRSEARSQRDGNRW